MQKKKGREPSGPHRPFIRLEVRFASFSDRAKLAWYCLSLVAHLPAMMNSAVMMVVMMKAGRPGWSASKGICSHSQNTRQADKN